MNRLLERLDALASTIVPLLYLAGLSLGTLAYFTGITADFNLAVGSALGFAVECHSFLQLRRTRATYGALSRMAEYDPRREQMARTLRVNISILAVLVAFSAYNATSFAAETWHPIGGFLPVALQVAIRGLIVPAFFLLAGFLSPLTQDAGALLADASHSMLHKTLRTTLKQWRKRVGRAEKRGLDLAPVAIALMRDAGDEDGARRVALIADGLNAAEGVTPPTGPGTPLPLPISRSLPDDDGYQSSWEMVPGFIDPYAPHQGAPAADASEQVERGEYTPGKLRELLAFKLLDGDPHMSRNALMNALRSAQMGCRDETLRGIMARWSEQRRNAPRALPQRGVQSDGDDDAEASRQAAI